MAAPPPKRPESGRTGLKGRHAMRAPNLPVLFHPDCNRRLRNRTESADPADSSADARGLWRSLAFGRHTIRPPPPILRRTLAGFGDHSPYRRWGLSPRPENAVGPKSDRCD